MSRRCAIATTPLATVLATVLVLVVAGLSALVARLRKQRT